MLALLKVAGGIEPFGSWMKHSDSIAARRTEKLDTYLETLYMLLDEYIFNDGSPRPQDLTFCEADLVLLGFWSKTRDNPKILRMPRRREA